MICITADYLVHLVHVYCVRSGGVTKTSSAANLRQMLEVKAEHGFVCINEFCS